MAAMLRSGSTGFVYDECMSAYRCPWDPDYVERPERFEAVLQRCEDLGLVQRCVTLKPRKATHQELLSVHQHQLIQLLKETENEQDTEVLKSISSRYDCVYLHPKSYDAALLSAGCAIDLTAAVLTGRLKNGFGVLRPPGHHAMPDAICGYCYFNNVALAAKHALSAGTRRILIVDWDVHHGHGTQRIFYDDPRVLYFSIHRFEYGTYWPELRESDFDHVGEAAGRGFNVNVPLNRVANTDLDYLSAFTQVLLPLAAEFDPELVLVSAGYDPAIGCPEGLQEVSPACFAHLLHLVSGLASGKVVALLEGGYFLPSLAEAAALTLKTMLGDPCPTMPKGQAKRPCKEMADAIKNVKAALRPYWKCFQLGDVDAGYTPEPKWLGKEDASPPSEYSTANPTPKRPADVEQAFEERLRLLVAATDLSRAERRLSVGCSDVAMRNFLWTMTDPAQGDFTRKVLPEEIEWMALHGIAVEKREQNYVDIGCILQAVDDVVEKRFQASLAVIEYTSESHLADVATFYAREKHRVERILLLMLDQGFLSKKAKAHKPYFAGGAMLSVVVSEAPKASIAKEGECNRQSIRLRLTAPDDGHIDADFLRLLYRLLLPVGYEFSPDVIVVYASLSSTWLSACGMHSLVHHLSALSNGRLVCVFEGSCSPFDSPHLAGMAAAALLGLPANSSSSNNSNNNNPAKAETTGASRANAAEIENVRNAGKQHWNSLNEY